MSYCLKLTFYFFKYLFLTCQPADSNDPQFKCGAICDGIGICSYTTADICLSCYYNDCKIKNIYIIKVEKV